MIFITQLFDVNYIIFNNYDVIQFDGVFGIFNVTGYDY